LGIGWKSVALGIPTADCSHSCLYLSSHSDANGAAPMSASSEKGLHCSIFGYFLAINQRANAYWCIRENVSFAHVSSNVL